MFIYFLLNHGFDNLYYKENESKTFMVQFLIWIDRIVCHYYIFYFIINTYNNDIFWILTINCGLTIGYIYYNKLQYMIELNNKDIKKPEIWHCLIHLFQILVLFFV